MKGFGFTRFAANLFTAPDVIKHYLCNVSRLHQVPIGTARTNDLYDDIKSAFAGSPYKLYLTDKYRVQFTVSRYGSHEILGQQNELRTPARLLTAHSTPLEENGKFDEEKQRLRDLEKGLIDRRNELNRERANIHKEKEELKVKQSEWRNRRDNVTNLERSLNNRENKLEMLSANRPDIEQARAALLETKRMASRAVHELAMKIISKLEAMRKICTEETLLRVTLESLRNTVSEDQEKLQELEEKRNEDLALIEGGLTTFRNAKKDLERAQEALFEHCGLKSLDVSKMTAADKKIWKLLNQMFIDEHVPDDKPSLLRLLEEEKVKLDIASKDGSKEDVDRCERLQREKTALLERKEQQEVSRETWRATMMKEIAEWRTPIEELISRINTNYSNFFAVLGCAGEVYLDVPEDPHDIANYGIMIMVSFRSGERLKRLDHQDCIKFLAGMDPVNERKVFEIMVDTLSGEGNLAKTQYFL
ncbi:unnamed protein product [Nippostrongylus brasiliensis]|uniref:Structural maintenance of chromosomes protein 5 n=1 Tax=Nippostrongylus brasiliensis TaxID=27835 RepID=A0A0N4YIB6_NIPBR|nr:unnamed protein product [Nippostrongylus brasiliensis]